MSGPLLVFGRTGQVAREIAKLADRQGRVVTFAGRQTIDLSHESGARLVRDLSVAAVINAAAYTAVDRAETESDQAFRLNRDAVGEIARACATAAVPLVHISTDYVFDGSKSQAYVEGDPRHPLGVYGASKAQGEQAVEAAGGGWAIVRTSWVYSAFGANFVKTMLRLAQDRDEIGVVSDQFGRPTWAEDVAHGALLLADRLIRGEPSAQGFFHLAGDGDVSWAGFAEAIFVEARNRGRPTARVRPITTAEFPTPARRPANSRLSSDKLFAAVGWRPAPWRTSLAACFDEIEAAGS